jgi:hypothetical protein
MPLRQFIETKKSRFPSFILIADPEAQDSPALIFA